MHTLTRRLTTLPKITIHVNDAVVDSVVRQYLTERAEWLGKQTYPNKYNYDREEIVDQAFELSEQEEEKKHCEFCGLSIKEHHGVPCKPQPKVKLKKLNIKNITLEECTAFFDKFTIANLAKMVCIVTELKDKVDEIIDKIAEMEKT